jgi:hypothetical protein
MNQFSEGGDEMKKLLLIPILAAALLGCDTAQWIKTAQEILPVVLPMVTNLVTAAGLLQGKTVSAVDLDTITRTANVVSNDLNLAGQLVSQYQSSPDPTTIGKINVVLGEVQSNLSGLLPALHISDSATAQKISAVVMLINSEVSSIQQILPIVSGGKVTARPATTPLSANKLKEKFNAIVNQPTNNPVVNQAFAVVSL